MIKDYIIIDSSKQDIDDNAVYKSCAIFLYLYYADDSMSYIRALSLLDGTIDKYIISSEPKIIDQLETGGITGTNQI